MTLKVEFVIHLPQTPHPQRCIVNINLDSSLPIIHKERVKSKDAEPFDFYFFVGREWITARISIDFVDFLVAKSFISLVEEWFETLKKTPIRKFNDKMFKKFDLARSILGQLGRVGMASFLCTYFVFVDEVSLHNLILAVALGLVLWSAITIIESAVARRMFIRVATNFIPAVILLTEGDEVAYSEVTALINSPVKTALGFVVTTIIAVVLNVLSSYIYTLLTSGG